MHLTKSILQLSLLPSVLAIPGAWANPGPGHRSECLSDTEAQFLVDIMVSFSVSFDADYAGQYLADDFTVQSDSINILTGGLLKPGETTAPSKAAFIAASVNLTTSSSQPAITVENIMHSCDEIAFRWVSATAPVPVQGIDILIIKKGKNLIEKDYSEFNNVADLVNAGAFPCH